MTAITPGDRSNPGFLCGLPHEHRHDDPQIEVHRDRRIQNSNHGKNVVICFDHSREQEVLSDKSGGRRNSCKRQAGKSASAMPRQDA